MLITEEAYKDYLDIEVDSVDFDVILSDLLEAAEDIILDKLHIEVTSEERVTLFNGNDTDELVLNVYPVTEVAKVEVYTDDWDEVTSDDYDRMVVTEEGTLLLQGYSFNEGRLNFRITFTAGYEEVPSWLALAFKRVAKVYLDTSPLRFGMDGLASVPKSTQKSEYYQVDKEAVDRIIEEVSGFRYVNT